MVCCTATSTKSRRYRRSAQDDIQPSTDESINLSIHGVDDGPRSKWFDANSELEHLQDNAVRLRAQLASSVSVDLVDTETQRIADQERKNLKQDLDKIQRLGTSISRINAKVQAQPLLETEHAIMDDEENQFTNSAISFIQTRDVLTDWAYCACNRSGENGTYFFPERDWPGIDLPIPTTPDLIKKSLINSTIAPGATTPPSSMLQLELGSRRIAIRESPQCNCINPWEFFTTNPSATCTVVGGGINVCLIRVNIQGHTTPGDSEFMDEQANRILAALDKAVLEHAQSTWLTNDVVNSTVISTVVSTTTSQPVVTNTTSSSSGFIEMIWNPFNHFHI